MDTWEEDWGDWNDDEEMTTVDREEKASTPERDGDWLQQCILSLSPTNDLMAVAYQDKCVLLSRKLGMLIHCHQ